LPAVENHFQSTVFYISNNIQRHEPPGSLHQKLDECFTDHCVTTWQQKCFKRSSLKVAPYTGKRLSTSGFRLAYMYIIFVVPPL